MEKDNINMKNLFETKIKKCKEKKFYILNYFDKL